MIDSLLLRKNVKSENCSNKRFFKCRESLLCILVKLVLSASGQFLAVVVQKQPKTFHLLTGIPCPYRFYAVAPFLFFIFFQV